MTPKQLTVKKLKGSVSCNYEQLINISSGYLSGTTNTSVVITIESCINISQTEQNSNDKKFFIDVQFQKHFSRVWIFPT